MSEMFDAYRESSRAVIVVLLAAVVCKLTVAAATIGGFIYMMYLMGIIH